MTILHIGNIANNAWQNAKLMDQVEGCDNTVLCYDYYHSMGTPEWEEADFDAAEIEDHFRPIWCRVNLNGYRRPETFVQGRWELCCRYLKCVSLGGKLRRKERADQVRANEIRMELALDSGLRSGKTLREQLMVRWQSCRGRVIRFVASTIRVVSGVKQGVPIGYLVRTWKAALLLRVLDAIHLIVRIVLVVPLALGQLARGEYHSYLWPKLRWGLTRIIPRLLRCGANGLSAILGFLLRLSPGSRENSGIKRLVSKLDQRHRQWEERDAGKIEKERERRKSETGRLDGSIARRFVRMKYRTWRRVIERRWGLPASDGGRVKMFAEWVVEFKERFPDREDQLAVKDCLLWEVLGEKFLPVFKRWDVIQAYSTDPIIPMVAGVPYFAFEHGTLRDIPFEDSPRGRMTALAYAKAEHVFVTNFDCLENAHKLTGDPSRVTFINHPFDENDLPDTSECENLRQGLLKELSADFLIFFPTRHDWIEGEGYNDKANDHLLKAVGNLKEKGYRVGLILCDWGHNQKESRKLIRELEFEGNTKWLAPQATKRFMKLCSACDVVADQFKLGSFGGILFKAMATSTAICTFLKEEDLLRMYDEVPPVVNARTAEEISVELEKVINNPTTLKEIALGGRKWIEKHHSGEVTVRKQMDQFKHCLEGAPQ